MPEPVKARYFASPDAFRRWLEVNHDRATELWVGFYKKGSGRRGITYPEAVDQALAFGWIDGVRRTVDAKRYVNRFTPRKRGSYWSEINIRRMRELIAAGLATPAGVAAFERRHDVKPRRYSYENRPHQLEAGLQAIFEAQPDAWANFRAQAPSYQRSAIFWVMSAVREETRKRRLDQLIEASAARARVAPLAARPDRQANRGSSPRP